MSDYVAAADRYAADHYRRVGRSGLLLPAISLGLWNNFGDDRPIEGQREILLRAFDLGITHFDLANNYGPGPGAAERNFGQVMTRELARYRDEIVISTKAGYGMWPGPYGDWGSRKYLLASLDQSLARMGVEYVDIYYHHRPDDQTPLEETAGALASAVRSGKALYVGVSNYSPEQTRAAAALLAEERVPLLIHQPKYNMFERDVEDGLLQAVEDVGVGVIAFSPLAQGLLTDRYLRGVPEGSRADQGRWLDRAKISEAYLRQANALQELAVGRGQSLAQLAITWVLRHSVMASALVGASSVAQLETNVAALDGAPLDDDEIAAIERILAATD